MRWYTSVLAPYPNALLVKLNSMPDALFNPKRAEDKDAVGQQHANRQTDNGLARQAGLVATDAMEAAWEEALRIEEAPHDPLPLWTKLATRILTAVGDGEHDPQRLKQIALTALDAQR
jgi:hypothetical protein